MKYKYRDNRSVAGCTAQAAGELMERIEKRDGFVTNQAFLDESRPEDAPTHGAFEWDDGVAAEKYRLRQATWLINSVSVVVEEGGIIGSDSPVVVNIVKGRNNPAEYKSMDVALSDAETRNTVLDNALAELKAFERKYARLSELAEVFKAIAAVERRANHG